MLSAYRGGHVFQLAVKTCTGSLSLIRLTTLLSWFVLSAALTFAAGPALATREGKLSVVRLLAVSRLLPEGTAADAAPDGLTFHFVVVRVPDAEMFTLKETRDSTLGGESYRTKTTAALGRQFEPRTVVNDDSGA